MNDPYENLSIEELRQIFEDIMAEEQISANKDCYNE